MSASVCEIPIKHRDLNFPTYGPMVCKFCGETFEKKVANQVTCKSNACDMALRRELYAKRRARVTRRAK